MSIIVNLTMEDIQAVYRDTFDGETMTPEQLATVAEEVDSRVNNYIDDLLLHVFQDIREGVTTTPARN